MDERSTTRTRRAGGCTGVTTRPTTGPRGACRARSGPPRTPSTATCARRTRSSTGRGGRASAEARRAALDAWERELHDGLAHGRSPHPVVGALVDAGRRHRLPLGELRTYMRSMRIDCAPVRITTWEELEAYMDGSAGSVGRIMAPLLGMPGAPPRRLRPARAGLPARELHPRRARGSDARPDLPARAGPRSPTASASRTWPARPPRRSCARCWPWRPAGPASSSRGPSRRSPRRRPPCAPGCASPSRSTCACSTAWSGSSSTSWAAGRACARGSCPAPRSGALRR